MRRVSVAVIAVFVLVVLSSSVRAQQLQSQSQQAGSSGRVWTNEDLDELRARGLISIMGPAEGAAPVAAPAPPSGATAPAQPAQAAAPRPPLPPRMQDPAWYAEQAAQLAAELQAREAAVQRSREALAQTRSLRNMQPGIDMSRGNAGVTPEDGIAVLEAQRRELQLQLEELADLARRNSIPPGALRG